MNKISCCIGDELVVKEGIFKGLVGSVVDIYENTTHINVEDILEEEKFHLEERISDLCKEKKTFEKHMNGEVLNFYHDPLSYRYVHEWCPHCEYEVKLLARMEVQECPSCKEFILPCSLCEVCVSECKWEKEVENIKKIKLL